MPNVFTPFPEIANDIEKPPGIGFLQPHRVSLLTAVLLEPGILLQAATHL
jgi:hypothetical protein